MAKKTTGKDNAGKATGTRETKCHKVSLGTPCEGGDIEMLFSPVSHTYICCDAHSDGKQQCVKTGTTPRNSGVPELLGYGTWLHRVWCTLVVSPVPDLLNGVSEVPRFAQGVQGLATC